MQEGGVEVEADGAQRPALGRRDLASAALATVAIGIVFLSRTLRPRRTHFIPRAASREPAPQSNPSRISRLPDASKHPRIAEWRNHQVRRWREHYWNCRIRRALTFLPLGNDSASASVIAFEADDWCDLLSEIARQVGVSARRAWPFPRYLARLWRPAHFRAARHQVAVPVGDGE